MVSTVEPSEGLSRELRLKLWICVALTSYHGWISIPCGLMLIEVDELPSISSFVSMCLI